MKILLASLYYYPSIGGVENSLRFLAKYLREQGHEVRVLAFDAIKHKDIVDVDGIKVYRRSFLANTIPLLNYMNIVSDSKKVVSELLNDFYPDQIWTRNSAVAYGISQTGFVNPILHLFPTTAGLNVKGLYSKRGDRTRIIRSAILWALKKIDYLSLSYIEKRLVRKSNVKAVVFSQMMKRQVAIETGLDKAVVIRPGVDNMKFCYPANPSSKAELLTQYPALNHSYILYVGRIAKAKNIEILIDSLAFIDSCYLVIVGDGPHLKELKNYILTTPFSQRIVFLGKQIELLPVIYSESIVTVLPTKVETFGQVLLESLASGVPVVGFGRNRLFQNAIDEIITDSYYGEIVSEYNAGALAKGINQMITKVHESKEVIAEKCKDYVTQKFNWNKTVLQLLRLGEKDE